ncbi:MAG: HIT family protein [Pseudomonadota bacterium]|nr:HIT family protein [Pseudomonadota bacterium]
MSNETMRKFGHPETLIREFRHWAVLVRPAQVTLGSLVLASTSEATRYSDLPAEAFAEQAVAVRAIEKALASFCSYERINYLMLMMVDPHVHFHVIPRYSDSREWKGHSLSDEGWPGPPQLQSARKLEPEQIVALREALQPLF